MWLRIKRANTSRLVVLGVTLLLFFAILAGSSSAEAGSDRPPAGKTIVVDPGHGGNSGARGAYLRSIEDVSVLAIGFKLRDMLERAGAEVVMTQEGPGQPRLADKPQALNCRVIVVEPSGPGLQPDIRGWPRRTTLPPCETTAQPVRDKIPRLWFQTSFRSMRSWSISKRSRRNPLPWILTDSGTSDRSNRTSTGSGLVSAGTTRVSPVPSGRSNADRMRMVLSSKNRPCCFVA
ncbi:MAG: N-acetylmuramoyl-L-alanine amidase [Bacillota bacterium]